LYHFFGEGVRVCTLGRCLALVNSSANVGDNLTASAFGLIRSSGEIIATTLQPSISQNSIIAVDVQRQGLNIPANWFNLAFKMRIPIEVNAGQVPNTQSDFPLLINGIFPDLIGNVQSAGQDIRIALPTKELLSYEIQSINSTTGELIVWAKMPTIDNLSKVFVYFDNPLANDAQNVADVWSNGYEGVWHLNQTTGTGNFILDSTANGNNVAPQNSPILGATGKIGKAITFDGVDQELTVANPTLPIGNSSYTLEAWTISAGNNNGGIIGWGDFTQPFDVSNAFNMDTSITERLRNTWRLNRLESADLGDLTSAFHHVIANFDSTIPTNVRKLFLDGVKVAEDEPGSVNVTDTSNFAIGRTDLGVPLFMDGTLDEVRVSNIARTQDYITTQFNNQNAPNTFYTIEPVEVIG